MAALLFFRPHAESSAGFGLRRKDDFIWRQAAFAQSADAQSIVSLGKAHTILVCDQVAVIPGWIAEAQSAI
jgi:hypothetical protein